MDKDYFSKSKYVKELIPKKDFDILNTYKLKNNSPHLILFYAPWCLFCKSVKEIWKKLGKNVPGVAAFNCEKYKVDLMKINMDCPRKILVKSYPTIILYKDGCPYKVFDKERNLENFINFYEKNL